MSSGEFVLTLLSAVLALVMWVRWYTQPVKMERLGAPQGGWTILRLTPLICLALLFVILRTLASHDVRDDVRYLGMYGALGAAWVAASMMLMPAVGLHVRDDVYERGNPAAAYAAAGALVGMTLAFAGGNIGDGPGGGWSSSPPRWPRRDCMCSGRFSSSSRTSPSMSPWSATEPRAFVWPAFSPPVG